MRLKLGSGKSSQAGRGRVLLLLRGTASHEVAFGVCVTPVLHLRHFELEVKDGLL